MRVITTVKAMRRWVRQCQEQGQSIGFVPTMGFLHEGHLSLVDRSVKECDCTVMSVFVNPAQFGPKEDLSAYPRDFKRDRMLARKRGVDVIFNPDVKEIYPDGFNTKISISSVTEELCGRFRPGHFDGVATVVQILLNIVQPHVFFLGQKDFQQCIVLKKMVEDLRIPTIIKMLPTVREKNGLALSSRNKYLTDEELNESAVLYQALKDAKKLIRSGEHNSSKVIRFIENRIKKTKGVIQYIQCVDIESLKPVTQIQAPVVLALAVYFGRARLIDNIVVRAI